MSRKSSFDLDNEYRLMLKGLLDDALDTYSLYEYSDFTDRDFTVSYKRGDGWFLEGLISMLKDKKCGIKERNTLRKGTKNYHAIFRDENGLIRKVNKYVNGSVDVTFFAVYKENKRYLLPFSDKYKCRYPTYVIVTEYADRSIIREYMVESTQIVYTSYEKLSDNEYKVEEINYVPDGEYPVLECEIYVISVGLVAEYRDRKGYSWYDEFNCIKKGITYAAELPEHIVRVAETEET